MSWGGGEFVAEAIFDFYFSFGPSKVVYFASAGDSPGTEYPCTSPEVVCVGGTSIGRNPNTLNFTGRLTGKIQAAVRALFSAGATFPTFPRTPTPITGSGFWTPTYAPARWYIVGGTSVSSPTWAGIVNNAGSFANAGSSGTGGSELNKLYRDPSTDFNDITIGSCGPYTAYLATVGWDYCTGRGSPRGYNGK